MCLAIPVLLKRVEGEFGFVEISGGEKHISLQLVPQAQAGQYVLLHAGFAIEAIDAAQAAELEYLIGVREAAHPSSP